jgi:hypothetical protein
MFRLDVAGGRAVEIVTPRTARHSLEVGGTAAPPREEPADLLVGKSVAGSC